MRRRYMVIDPGPMTTPGRAVREVDLDNLPEHVTVDGHRFKRADLRPRYHVSREDALRDAAKRVVRDAGAPGGVSRRELAGLDPEWKADIADEKRSLRQRYAKLLKR